MKYYIKRCIGLPGDTVSIKKRHVQGERCGCAFREYCLTEAYRINAPEDFSEGVYKCFPYDSLLDWSIKEFGPLFVPGNGGCSEDGSYRRCVVPKTH